MTPPSRHVGAGDPDSAVGRPGVPPLERRTVAGLLALPCGLVVADECGLLGRFGADAVLALGPLTVAAIILGIRRNRPVAGPWILIAVSMTAWLVSGTLRIRYATVGNLTSTRSVVPDLVSLPSYAIFAVALAWMVRRKPFGRADADILLDAGIVGAAAFTLAWRFLIVPTLDHSGAPVRIRLLLACYPALSVTIMAIAVRAGFATAGRSSLSSRVFLSGIGLLMVGDTLYMLADARLADVPGQLLNLPYSLAYLCAMASVLDPSIAAPPPRPVRRPPTAGSARLGFLAVAVSTPTLLALVPPTRGAAPERPVILVVLAVLAALRLVRTLRGQERLLRRSEIDPLTGLANRSAFTAGLATMIDWCVLSGAGVAVLFVDLDRFKAINDTLGHAAGDEVLVAVGHRLRSVVGDDDLVARFAGDEFVVAAAGIPSTAVAEELAERVRASLAAPVAAGQTVLTCTATVGAVFYAAVELPHLAETAIHEADLAMYRAKAATGTGRATPTVPIAVGTLAVGAGAGLPSGMERDGPTV